MGWVKTEISSILFPCPPQPNPYPTIIIFLLYSTYAFIPFNRVVIVLWQRIEISTYYFLLYFCFFTAYQVSRISLALVKLADYFIGFFCYVQMMPTAPHKGVPAETWIEALKWTL